MKLTELISPVITYTVLMALTLLVCLSMNSNGKGYMAYAFAMPVMPALSQLLDRHVVQRKLIARLTAVFAFVMISCVAYAVHWFMPDRLPFPSRAPLWTASTGILAIPAIYVADAVWEWRNGRARQGQ